MGYLISEPFPFAERKLEHWAVVDSIRVPEVAQLAYKHELQPELQPLLRGSRFEHLLEQSPALFRVSGDSALLPLWKQAFLWQSSGAIFSVPIGTDLMTLMKHLHNLLTPHIAGKPVFFRYYSNKIWLKVAQELSEQDRNTLLGPAVALSWADDAQQWHSLEQDPSQIKLSKTPYSFTSQVWNHWI